MSVAEIRAAIEAELEATPEYYDFRVERAEREGDLWRVTLQGNGAFTSEGFAQVVLDDSFDGADAWWGGPPKGHAKVLTVIAEDDQVVLKGASATPPGRDLLIRLYPPRFLSGLAQCWQDDAWAARAWAGLADLRAPQAVAASPLPAAAFGWLRPAQRRALGLVAHSSGFLWGPPGTGKTTTLGALLAEYLHVNPGARVLLLSTTNQAVDQALVAVDRALEAAARPALRQAVKRVGTQFSAAHYAGREHLLPVFDRALVGELARAENRRPAQANVAAYAAWSDDIGRLRKRMRAQTLAVLRGARLAAMTTTRAAFTLGDLRELPPFDLVVFDEASQVGLAHALALMPLGRARLFAGDPEQLAPIVRSAEREVQRWLGRSAFSEMPRRAPSVCVLDEQSRMAPPIGELVSRMFYDGALRVAADAQADDAWIARRRRAFAGSPAEEHVRVLEVAQDGGWSATWRGPVRAASAAMVVDAVREAIAAGELAPHELVVLTPFRAQRALLRQRLAAEGLHGVKVSTVHKAQGSEAEVVVFDPVDGASDFMNGAQAARLVNVALSRARAKLVVLLSRGDAASPLLRQIANRQRLADSTGDAMPLAELFARPGFPNGIRGLRVAIGRHVVEVIGVSRDGSTLTATNVATGAEQVFDVAFLRRKAQEAG